MRGKGGLTSLTGVVGSVLIEVKAARTNAGVRWRRIERSDGLTKGGRTAAAAAAARPTSKLPYRGRRYALTVVDQTQ